MVILSFCFVLNAHILKSSGFFARKKNAKEQKSDNQPVVDGIGLKGDDLVRYVNGRFGESGRDIEKEGNRIEILEGLVAKICINMSGDERLKHNLENGNNISVLYLAEEQRLWLQGRLTAVIKNMNGLAAKQYAMQSELTRLGILAEENEGVMLRVETVEDCFQAGTIELKKILEQQDIQVRNDFEAAIIKSQQELATRLTALQERVAHIEISHGAGIKAQVAVQSRQQVADGQQQENAVQQIPLDQLQQWIRQSGELQELVQQSSVQQKQLEEIQKTLESILQKQLQEAESQRQVQIAAQQEIKAAMESRLQEAESQRAAQMVGQASVPQEVLDRLDRLEASNAMYRLIGGLIGIGVVIFGAVAFRSGIFNKSQKEIS